MGRGRRDGVRLDYRPNYSFGAGPGSQFDAGCARQAFPAPDNARAG